MRRHAAAEEAFGDLDVVVLALGGQRPVAGEEDDVAVAPALEHGRVGDAGDVPELGEKPCHLALGQGEIGVVAAVGHEEAAGA